MTGLTRILIGSLVLLLMTKESYQECYAENGESEADGDFCFDTNDACWSSLNPTRLPVVGNQFHLFTREQTSGNTQCLGGTTLIWNDATTFTNCSSTRKTIVIIHGWRGDSDDKYLVALCEAFMELGDYNIIMVNWKDTSNDYILSILDSRLAAKELAVLLERLHEDQRLQYADVHLLGHSLGAHLAGYTGEFLDGQIGQITGLDPASPGFKSYVASNAKNCYLDNTDADFVDVIHSDGSLHLFGLKNPVGDQDFYPNKGDLMQPCCMLKLACSHMRAFDFYISSIKNIDVQPSESCSFVTKPVSSTWSFLYGSTITCNGVCPRMGINAAKGATGRFKIDIDDHNCGVDFIL